jgi:4-amino-4-deoxy-L-arabinose transferase-like glycosyltransferase
MKRNNRVSEFIKANGLVLVLCVAFAIRFAFYISLQPWNNEVVNKTILVTDSPSYHNLALSLISTKSFESFDGFRTPGYPIFLAIFYSIIPNSVWLALFVQILISVLSAYLVYKIASFYFSKNVSLLASFLFAIDYIQIISSVQIMTDTLFVFFFLEAILFLCKYFKFNKTTSLIYSSLLLGCATFVRPVSYLFPIVVVLLLIFISHTNYKRKLYLSVLYCFVFVFTLSPWIIRNHYTFGDASLTSVSGYNLLFYNVASVESYKSKMPIDVVQKNLGELAIKSGCNPANSLTTLANTKIYTKISIDYIKANFVLYCIRNINGIIYMYCASPAGAIIQNFHIESKYADYVMNNRYTSGFKYSDIFKLMSPIELLITFFGFVYLFANYLFSVYGLTISMRIKENFKFILFAVFIVLYFTALTGIVGASRYRMPFMPFINIFCATGIANFYKIIKKKKEKKSLPA